MDLLPVLRIDLDQYASKVEDSVRTNKHMNSYDGHVPIVDEEAKAWLDGFIRFFTEDYWGGRSTGDVVMAMAGSAKLWREIPSQAMPHSDQATRDAVLVDFINFVAGKRGMDLAMYTSDL